MVKTLGTIIIKNKKCFINVIKNLKCYKVLYNDIVDNVYVIYMEEVGK